MTAVSEQSIITIDLTQADAIAQLLPYQPLLSSEKAWDSIQVEYHRQADVESLEHRFQQHLICIPITPPIKLERVLNDERKTYEFGCGNLFIAPAGTLHRATSKGEAEFINLILDPTVLTKIAHDSVNPEQIELLPRFRVSDPLIQSIGFALKAELEADRLDNRLYAETMATALAAHLIQHYSTRKPIIREYVGGLSKPVLKLALDYINDHLDQNVSIAELAAIAQMSSYYFVRMFKQSTGLPPHRYLIEQRLKRAKQLLRETNLLIADIAYAVGFSSQSRFATAFRQHTAMTPRAFREQNQ